jgi:hypothetical protein
MSNQMLLFTLQTHGMPEMEHEVFVRGTKSDAQEARVLDLFTKPAGEIALPSGVASMEHWLDLNA